MVRMYVSVALRLALRLVLRLPLRLVLAFSLATVVGLPGGSTPAAGATAERLTISDPERARLQLEDELSFWIPPVLAAVVDPFRPPSNPYGAGNRGVEYGTSRGDEVVAVAVGTVDFAGQVGGDLFVVVVHPTGPGEPTLRSTYAYLATIEVSRGDEVGQGQRVALADQGFHLTARLGSTYVDPEGFMGLPDYTLRLVSMHGAVAQGVSAPPRRYSSLRSSGRLSSPY